MLSNALQQVTISSRTIVYAKSAGRRVRVALQEEEDRPHARAMSVSKLAHFPVVSGRTWKAINDPCKRTLMSLMISMAWSRAKGSTGSLSLARSSTSARLTRRRRGRPSVAMVLEIIKVLGFT
jgi:hypothetical protein